MNESQTSGDITVIDACVRSGMKGAFGARSILVVDDEAGIRDLLVTRLEMDGYAATSCATAEAALAALREETFDFVLTDYALPNRSGGWLLQQARAEGLLEATPAVIVTAHFDPTPVAGFDVVHKPFDLDELIDQVRRRIEDGSTGRVLRVERDPDGRRSLNGHTDGCPEPIELVLYMSAEWRHCATADENIRRILRSLNGSGRFTLTICDAESSNAQAATPAIAVTTVDPRQSAGPRTSILGHITNADLLVELLQECDEPPPVGVSS